MWFLNLPTGLILVALSPLLPESARFLQQMGRAEEARAILAKFGAVVQPKAPVMEEPEVEEHPHLPPIEPKYLGITTALTIGALCWGLVNFGLLLWLPSALVSEGRSVGLASALIAESTLIAAPTVGISIWLYSAWSTKWSLVLTLAVTALGLLGFVLRHAGVPALANPIPPLVLLIVGSCGVVSMILPYTAENFPLRIRGRSTGWIAGCSKLGGLLAQGLSVVGAVPPFGVAAAFIAAPTVLSLALIAYFGRETKGRDLRDLERGEARRASAYRQS